MPDVKGAVPPPAHMIRADPLLGWRIQNRAANRTLPSPHLRALGNALVIQTQIAQGCAGVHRASDAGLVTVMVVIEGQERGEDAWGKVLLQQGDVIVWSTRETLAFEALSPLRKMMIAFPEADTRILRPDRIGRGRLHLSGRRGFGAALSGYFKGLAGTIAEMEDGEARSAVDTGLEVVARAARLAARDAPPSRSSAQLARIASYVDAHLQDPDLDGAEIAASFGLSVRSVQFLFAELGTTPSQWIRQRRLDRCHSDLEAAGRTESITDIALRWGFNDPSHFSRLFRRRYGVTPRTLRGQRRHG